MPFGTRAKEEFTLRLESLLERYPAGDMRAEALWVLAHEAIKKARSNARGDLAALLQALSAGARLVRRRALWILARPSRGTPRRQKKKLVNTTSKSLPELRSLTTWSSLIVDSLSSTKRGRDESSLRLLLRASAQKCASRISAPRFSPLGHGRGALSLGLRSRGGARIRCASRKARPAARSLLARRLSPPPNWSS